MKLLNHICRVIPNSQTILYEDGAEVPGPLALLALHYLIGAKDIPFSGRLLPYRRLPDGAPFAGPFKTRSLDPLARVFGADPAAFLAAGAALGGASGAIGDASVEVFFFPRLPVKCVLWAECEEFPAEANILFDSTAVEHFHIEDLAVVGEVTAHALIRASGRGDTGVGILHDRKP